LTVLQALLRKPSPPRPLRGDDVPFVTVVVAAYREATVIERRIQNLRALDWPAGRIELIVACDGSDDGTPEAARAAGADTVLDLPRGGKIRAQNAAVRAARGELIAFSDANAVWKPDALRALAAAFNDPEVAYVCGRVRFGNADGTNQEGLYWRFEMFIRGLEAKLSSVTAGNGAIYAVRASDYVEVDPVMGHDLKLPFTLVKAGRRAIEAPLANATELMVPSIEGEFARKRRMMSHAWPIVIKGGLLSPKGYSPLYALMIFSHRAIRYASPLLHVVALISSAALAPGSVFWTVVFGGQLLILVAAVAAKWAPSRLLLVCRYYVLMTAAIAGGFWEWTRHGTEAGWEPPEGTR
jgi:glycosyltransferase involved in cell wall biosynthesis